MYSNKMPTFFQNILSKVETDFCESGLESEMENITGGNMIRNIIVGIVVGIVLMKVVK